MREENWLQNYMFFFSGLKTLRKIGDVVVSHSRHQETIYLILQLRVGGSVGSVDVCRILTPLNIGEHVVHRANSSWKYILGTLMGTDWDLFTQHIRHGSFTDLYFSGSSYTSLKIDRTANNSHRK